MTLFNEYHNVIKLDYYGQPYTAVEVVSKRPDYGKLWRVFAERMNQPERSTGGQHGTINETAINGYHENRLNEYSK